MQRRKPSRASDDRTKQAHSIGAWRPTRPRATRGATTHQAHNASSRQDGSGHTLLCMVSSAEKVGFFSSLSRSDVAINRKSRSSDSNCVSHDVWVVCAMAILVKSHNKLPRPPPAHPTGHRGGGDQPASGCRTGGVARLRWFEGGAPAGGSQRWQLRLGSRPVTGSRWKYFVSMSGSRQRNADASNAGQNDV